MKDYISQDHCVYQNPFSLKMDFLSANQIRHGMEARLEKNLSTLCFKDWQLVMDINLRRFPNFIAGFWHMNSWLGKFHWCESLSVFWNLTITSAADISGEVHSKIFMENFIKRFLRNSWANFDTWTDCLLLQIKIYFTVARSSKTTNSFKSKCHRNRIIRRVFGFHVKRGQTKATFCNWELSARRGFLKTGFHLASKFHWSRG